MADHVYPVYDELMRLGAQGNLFFNDDTTMKILSLLNAQHPEATSSRKAVFTSAILATYDGHRMALFFTGRKHAGENMADLLKNRTSGLDPPIQMCDALSRNVPQGFRIVLANCLTHARRNFIDAMAGFPDKCQHVLEALGAVYHHDQISKEQEMSPSARLSFHQDQSGPIMKGLKGWLQEQLEKKEVEPNSPMGKAIAYMLKHWEPLTLFLRVPGAPLDNNVCEQALKKALLHRKNSLLLQNRTWRLRRRPVHEPDPHLQAQRGQSLSLSHYDSEIQIPPVQETAKSPALELPPGHERRVIIASPHHDHTPEAPRSLPKPLSPSAPACVTTHAYRKDTVSGTLLKLREILHRLQSTLRTK